MEIPDLTIAQGFWQLAKMLGVMHGSAFCLLGLAHLLFRETKK